MNEHLAEFLQQQNPQLEYLGEILDESGDRLNKYHGYSIKWRFKMTFTVEDQTHHLEIIIDATPKLIGRNHQECCVRGRCLKLTKGFCTCFHKKNRSNTYYIYIQRTREFLSKFSKIKKYGYKISETKTLLE